MNARALSIVLSLLAVISAVSAIVGSFKPIEDIHDPYVQEIAKYAVAEHNKKSGDSLVYVETVRGESQVVGGINYRLQISAKDGAAVKKYEAVVYDKDWAHFRSLISFKPI